MNALRQTATNAPTEAGSERMAVGAGGGNNGENADLARQ
jgi:hypothetical protein